MLSGLEEFSYGERWGLVDLPNINIHAYERHREVDKQNMFPHSRGNTNGRKKV